MQGVLMWAADDNETTSDLWRAFSNYTWKKGGRLLAAQPAGWAQIKYSMHVRAAPQGQKVRGLMKNNLVPIWELNAERWAAITPRKDEWIYLGDPTLTEVSMETPKSELPPAGLFRAVVTPARGLNVRAQAFGRLLRTLRSGDLVEVYKLQQGWAKIHFEQDEWVNSTYLRRLETVQQA
jgi:hypothetical protein